MNLKSIFDECLLFERKAEDIRVVPNDEPFLQKLSNIKDFDDRIKFAEEHCEKKLGEGSSRTAFLLNKDFILKVAHNEKGLAQNRCEAEVSLEGKECVNNALVSDVEHKWIIFANSEKLTEKRFKEITGFSFSNFTDTLLAKFNNESDAWGDNKNYEEIEKLPFFLCVSEIVFANDLLIGDLSKISSYRERDGKVILADVGLSKKVWEQWYKSDSSSSSPSTVKTTEK